MYKTLAAFLFAALPAFGSFRGMQEDAAMQILVKQIFGMIALTPDVVVFIDPGTPYCAYTGTTSAGQFYVGFDPVCVGPLRIGKGYNYRVVGIMCHEVAHLASGHVLNSTSSHREELEADRWAGWCVRRMGGSLDEAQSAFRTFSEAGSSSHPPRVKRLQAVAEGWGKADTEILEVLASSSAPTPSPTVLAPPITRTSESIPQSGSVPSKPPPLPTPRKSWWQSLMESPVPWSR